ncbi:MULTISPECIES: sensor histidine kinase [Streptomyces]|uniref:histidine kinase n=1 Tax=Streptomyces doudnae TaxID=3075536 RepID=A0ABD5F0H2_9ACTN|nr:MULTISPECIES: ATP-binding protein [unclassified Streptomyces]MDT0439983.1 ATP-binding protein [Streptomyces sp. DSM 41981]MYQ62312.1 sensor histidine kinase [Streptomyces sp. SID4950]SCD34862.1 Histidine kinase-, DNA gyrase B-, and HSP90-like ATPase [Streptomyces sp. SolWspMP-5a-2]
MSDSAFPARPAATGHRRRRPPLDANTLYLARRAVALPLVVLAALLLAAFGLRSGSVVGPGWALTGLVCGLSGVVAVAAHGARAVAGAVQLAVEELQAAALNGIAGAAAAVEKSVQWSADELCRGKRPPLPDPQTTQSPIANAEINNVLGALQAQAIASLIRVHDESQSVVLLEVLRRLAMREHALVSKALQALSELEMLTDDPELLAKIFEIDHLVTRMRRQVESTAVLGGQSLRSVRRPVPVATALRGAVSEVVQYPRVAVAAGSVGAELGLPGHVGPDLTHLLAELIENACECSDPATRVMVRAQRVPHGLAIEVEDRAIPMHPQARAQMNHLLKAPAEVDVSGQVRAGQLGLLVAAKIAQSHGLSVLLQENVTGGTTALVVIPARLLVAIPTIEDAGALPPEEASGSGRQSQQVAAAPVAPGPVTHLGAASTSAGHSADAPALPARRRRSEPFRPPHERQALVSAATPGLAAAFRGGLQAGGTVGSPTTSAEHPTS